MATLAGISLVIASACIFNNTIDREADAKMPRTQNRPLVTRLISVQHAILFAVLLGVVGFVTLFLYTNLLTTLIAITAFFIYVILYSFWKYHTTHATLVGSFAGGAPPIIGYCAVSNHFDMGALLIFVTVALWQMPHFFSIALYRLEDYTAAGIPVLPVKKGTQRTKIQMIFYVFAFVIASLMLTLVGYAGILYLTMASLLGLGWLWLSFKGLKCVSDVLWARRMFLFSLLIITLLCLTLFSESFITAS